LIEDQLPPGVAQRSSLIVEHKWSWMKKTTNDNNNIYYYC